jgi:glycine/D-amino acid oxidase-like deaminating enzyme
LFYIFSLGCQTLYHLAKMGVTNTVLLEKDQLTAGRRMCSQINAGFLFWRDF